MSTLITRGLALAALAAVAVAGPAAATEAKRAQAKANFLKADADADGALTSAEFKSMIDLNAQHDIGRSRMIQRFGKYDMAFGRIDADRNGLVTRDELAAAAARAQR